MNENKKPKEKKDYKEALKDIVNIINAAEKSDIGFVNICSYLDTNCPELMKSKDDIMREKIIATIHLYYGEPIDDEAKEMIAWLKEQRDKDKLIQELGEYKVKYTQEVLGKHLNDISHKDDESLEKQGEQKSQRMISAEAKEALFDFKDEIQQEDSAPKTEPSFLFKVKYDGKEYNVRDIVGDARLDLYDETNPECFIYIDLDDCEIIRGGYGIKENGSQYPTKSATFSEQESDDKVESKFKVNDWVVRKDGEKFGNGCKFAQITNIDKEKYWFDSGTWLEKEEIRLWTIEDAKDGDIVVDGYGNIGIFEKRWGINWHTYCYLENESRFISVGGSHGSFCSLATKEQRNLFFQKMAEAGYEWDVENKKLNELPYYQV